MRRMPWEILAHLLFWVISYWALLQSFAFEYVQEISIDGNSIEEISETSTSREYLYFPLLFGLTAKAVLVYVNAFILAPAFFKEKDWKKYIAWTIPLVAATLGLEFGLNAAWNYLIGNIPFYPFFTALSLNLLLSLFFWGLSNAYVFGKQYFKNERLKQQLIQDKLAAELQFLKTQINPHFLFNTLNNLFALSERSKNVELSTGLAELSNLMRYMLYDAKAEQVALDKEVAYLKSVIEIQQLRLSPDDDIAIGLEVEGDYTGKKIAPLILISFVENAFKHGIDLRQSSFIKIKLQMESKRLHFSVVNSKFESQANELDEHSGIGLENVRRRLTLIYPEKHDLKIEESTGVFKVHLLIYLDH